MYNRLYMDEGEVPSTTEELYAYMEKTTHGGHYGFVEQHSTPYYAAGWIHGYGGYILDENGVPGLNEAKTIEAIQYHKKFVDLMPGETEYAIAPISNSPSRSTSARFLSIYFGN